MPNSSSTPVRYQEQKKVRDFMGVISLTFRYAMVTQPPALASCLDQECRHGNDSKLC